MKVSEIIKESDEKSVKVIQASIEGFSRQGMSYGAIREMLISMAPEELVDALIQEHKNENDNETIAASILKSEKYKDKAIWYKKVEGDDSRWSRLKNHLTSLKKPWEPEHIADLDIQSDLVVKNLAPPSGDPGIYKGMVLGYVQSGKTANFSASIAKAIDQGYRIIIVLGGMYNNLRSQTQRRLEAELVNTFDRDKTICLTDTTDTGDFKEPTGITAGNLLSNKPVFCVIKKNVSPMKRFLKWFKDVNLEHLKKYPVLIIDDEADQASVNNNDPEKDRTAINHLLTEIMSFFGENTVTNYVGYTATPFANIFIDAQDRADIFPEDFFISLKPPTAYNGTLKLFGRASIDGDDAVEGIDVFRDIEAHEIDDLKNLSSLTKLPDSLRYAIDSYYLACAERVIRGQKKDDMTMLVHTSHLKDDHKEMCRLINNYIEHSKSEFKAGTSYLDTLEKIWESDFVKTTRDSFGETKVSPFTKIKDGLEIFFIDFLPEAIRENSDSKTRLDFTGDDPVHAIVVGGNTLSRGLTIEGLTVSYFQRNSKGYDTLLQMGRWFGYRKNYLDLTRIFVTPEMHENFYFLATVEEEIREDIDQMALNGERPRDVSIKVREHDKLQITGRKTLKNNSVFSARTYSGSKIQARYVIPGNKLIAENNHKVVEDLVKDLESSDSKSSNLYSVHENSLLFRNVESEKIISFLEGIHLSKDDKKMSVKLLGPYIQKLNQRSELNDWSVAIMSRKNGDDLRKVNLGNSFIYSLNRSYAPRLFSQDDNLKHPLNTLMGYRDELIDMKDVMGDEFVKVLESRVDSISYKQVRKRRPNERGLLIIYPIYTNHNLPKDELDKLMSEKKTLIYSESEVLYTIAMIFPFSQVPEMTFNYRENFTVKK